MTAQNRLHKNADGFSLLQSLIPLHGTRKKEDALSSSV